MEVCLRMVKVLDGRSGNASEYVYLFLKGLAAQRLVAVSCFA